MESTRFRYSYMFYPDEEKEQIYLTFGNISKWELSCSISTCRYILQSGYTLKWKVNAANWTKLLFCFRRTEEEEYDAEEETGLLEKTTSYRLFPF
ncbi:hypothetical protein ACHWQZ_G009798 [Mnemiopsis leidyi]